MATASIAYPSSYADAEQLLKGRNRTKIGHNTWLERRTGGDIAIIYHRTPIVTLSSGGTVRLDNGGYWTRTTAYRISRALGSLGIGCLTTERDRRTKDVRWSVLYRNGHEEPFTRGMVAAFMRGFIPVARPSEGAPVSVVGMQRLRLV